MTSNLDKKLKVICSLVMLAALALMPITGAGDLQAQDSETLQRGPVNPDFLRFLEEPPEPFYGYIPPPMDLSHLDAIPVEAALKLTTLPGRFDWRDEGKVTSVKNQGPCGTCWAFCTLAGLESRVLIVEDVAYTAGDAAYDYSEQNLICCTDPAYVYLDGDRCNRGSWGLVAGDTLIKKGVRLEACQPYDTATINEEGCDDSCEPVKTVTGGRMIAFQAASPHVVGPIKTALRNHGPLITAYCHADGYLYAGSIYYWPDCTQTANHCALIVGWDDNIEWPDQSGTGAWIVKNSWGTRWGDDGYFYLCYGSGNMAGVGFADYKDYDPYEVLYYWDEAGMVTDVGYNTPSAWMANIFTSTQNGTLTHVDFYTTSNNAQYEIHVYLDGDISDGLQNLASSQAGTCQEFGYYSIQLDSAVPLSVGDAFAIEVKMTTPGYGRPVPVEVVLQGFVEPPIQSGVSYMRQGRADPWEDLAPSGYNACLRARVSVAQPGITANPGSFELTLFPDTTQEYTLSIGNTSDATLDYDITIQETIGRAGMVVGENLFLGEPASMALEAPLKRSPVEPQHPGQTQSGWQSIMTEDLEGTSPGDWGLRVTGGASDAYWGKCRCDPHTGSHSAFCAKSRTDGVNPPAHYPSNMDDWMFYGPFSLEDATAADLNLWLWLDTESDYDLFQCVASVDGQNFSGWSWSGNNADWESESLDLTDVPTLGNLCGQPEVWIAFIFTIDQTEAYPGVFVDDVVMRKYAEEVPAGFWLDVNPKSGSVAPGGSDSIAVTVNTTGLAPGDHHAEIVICGNDPDQNPKVVPVKLHVSNPDPSVTTQTASAIGSDLATLNLTYTLGAYSSVDVRFAYKKAGDHAWTETSWVSVLTPSGFLSEGGTHEETLIGLSSNTAYEFKAQLRYDETAIEGSVLTFATERTEPTVTTEDATDVTTNSADLNMSFTVGDYSPVEVRFNWREDGIDVWTESIWTPQESDGTHTETPSGLNSNTVYEFKTQLKHGHPASVIEGDVLTFITNEKGGCFIATAAYGTPMAEEVQILREFRDGYLLTNRGGQALVAIYYRTSPPIAGLLDQHPTLKPIVRAGLVPAVTLSALVVNTTSADKAAATGPCMLVLVAAAVWARRRRRRPEYS